MQKRCGKKIFFFRKFFFSDPHFSPKPSPQKVVILGDVSHCQRACPAETAPKNLHNWRSYRQKNELVQDPTMVWAQKNISGVAYKLLHTRRERSRRVSDASPRLATSCPFQNCKNFSNRTISDRVTAVWSVQIRQNWRKSEKYLKKLISRERVEINGRGKKFWSQNDMLHQISFESSDFEKGYTPKMQKNEWGFISQILGANFSKSAHFKSFLPSDPDRPE
jgi:hypothetical protein